jgi:hypothetical protein
MGAAAAAKVHTQHRRISRTQARRTLTTVGPHAVDPVGTHWLLMQVWPFGQHALLHSVAEESQHTTPPRHTCEQPPRWRHALSAVRASLLRVLRPGDATHWCCTSTQAHGCTHLAAAADSRAAGSLARLQALVGLAGALAAGACAERGRGRTAQQPASAAKGGGRAQRQQ